MQTKSSRKQRAAYLLFVPCLLASALQPLRAADEYVVIVNQANPADSITPSDLKKMFLGDRTSWATGGKVTAVTPASESPEYAPAIKRVTGMSPTDFKRYILQMSFLGKPVNLPRAFESAAAVTRFVSGTPGAVGCVPASAAAPGVKIVKVE